MGDAIAMTSSEPDIGAFVKALAEEGLALVGPREVVENRARALEALGQLHELACAELGLPAPDFSPEAALWGVKTFHQLCRFTVCRDIGEEEIKAACAVSCPGPRGPATDWSADLTLRHLPKLYQLAQHLSNADPLLQAMRQIACEWPLSSVGIADVVPTRIDSFADDPALRRLYADRIIARSDVSRLGDPRIDDLLRTDLGLHRDLAPALSAKLFEYHDTH